MAVSRGPRAWILWTSALLSLIGLAWMGAVLVVHVQVGREIAELKRRFRPAPPARGQDVFERWTKDYHGAYNRILDRGCPALPRLIDALDPADDATYSTNLSTLIPGLVLRTHGDQNVGATATALPRG